MSTEPGAGPIPYMGDQPIVHGDEPPSPGPPPPPLPVPPPQHGNPNLNWQFLCDESVLSEDELWWSNQYDWLIRRGYRLRSRYRVGWVPSWSRNGMPAIFCEDSLKSTVCLYRHTYFMTNSVTLGSYRRPCDRSPYWKADCYEEGRPRRPF
jgi:hypothetical protein